MTRVGLFEAKTKFSELCDRVAKKREPIVVTKRGEPLVLISPMAEKKGQKSVWDLRREFVSKHGRIIEKLLLPPRLKTRKKSNPLDA